MVNLVADNAKLRGRAAGIVAAVAGAGEDAARAALDATGGAVKPAILVAAGAARRDRRRPALLAAQRRSPRPGARRLALPVGVDRNLTSKPMPQAAASNQGVDQR